MVKANYKPWHVDSTQFSDTWSDMEKLRFFAQYAVLAPSGHNTQPWQFHFETAKLVLKVNPARELPFSGELAAEPYISLGCCLETLCLAAKGFGYELKVSYLFNQTGIAEILIRQRVAPMPELLAAINLRRSNRSFHKADPVSKQIQSILASNEFSDVSLHFTDKAQEIGFLADQTYTATVNIMSQPAFRNELSKWVRNNVTKQHDGMPGFVQGMPTPPSLIARHVVKNIDISKGQAKKDAARVKHSALIALVSAHNTKPETLLNAGRLYARLCIIAQQHDIATSGVGAAAIDPSTKQAIAERLKLKYPPTAMIRLGYVTKPARHTPRWPLEKVTV